MQKNNYTEFWKEFWKVCKSYLNESTAVYDCRHGSEKFMAKAINRRSTKINSYNYKSWTMWLNSIIVWQIPVPRQVKQQAVQPCLMALYHYISNQCQRNSQTHKDHYLNQYHQLLFRMPMRPISKLLLNPKWANICQLTGVQPAQIAKLAFAYGNKETICNFIKENACQKFLKVQLARGSPRILKRLIKSGLLESLNLQYTCTW